MQASKQHTVTILAMSVKKKILLDEGVRDLARFLPELGIERVTMIEDHDLHEGTPDTEIVRKLKQLATPKAGYLFITKNGKHFISSIAKQFDVLIIDNVNTADANFLVSFKQFLGTIGKEPTGTVYKARKSGDRGTPGYIFVPIRTVEKKK